MLRNKLDGFMRRLDRNNENNPYSDLCVNSIKIIIKTGNLETVGVILDTRILRISAFSDIYLVTCLLEKLFRNRGILGNLDW